MAGYNVPTMASDVEMLKEYSSGSITIISTAHNYPITVMKAQLYQKIPNSLISTALEYDPEVTNIDLNQQFLTPEVMLTLKYLILGTILDPDDTILPAKDFNAIRGLIEKKFIPDEN